VACHPTRQARILASPSATTVPMLVGALGEVDPVVLQAFGLPPERRVGWLVLDLANLLAVPRRSPLVRPVSRFPPSDVDLAFVLDLGVPASSLVALIKEAAGSMCEWARVIDVYQGAAVVSSARGVTVRARLRSLERTLSEQDVAAFRDGAIALAASRLGAHLRR